MTARDITERVMVLELGLPEELQDKIEELIPHDLVDVKLLAHRLDLSRRDLLAAWRDAQMGGAVAPRVWQISPQRLRVSLSEFETWWHKSRWVREETVREARRKKALRDLPAPAARKGPRQKTDLDEAKRELRSVLDQE